MSGLKSSLAAACLLLLAVAANGQITYKPAFGNLTFSNPVAMAEMPGRPGYFVVVEKSSGVAYLAFQQNGTWTKQEFYKIPGGVYKSLEQGFLGFTFHPNYASNHKYYIMYCPPTPFANIFEEREADATGLKDGGGKGVELIHMKDPYENHNAGCLNFGRDGYLYMSTGDGGNGGDPGNRAQSPDSLFGKILRIDVDHKAGGDYGIPADNPYAKGGGRPEVYAYGLRNPWKYSFDAVTGDLWVGEVGQNNIEEVDVVTKGGNYGWHVWEADACYKGPCPAKDGFIFPVHSYPHGSNGNAIIGGYVYRGEASSPFYGKYFFADNGSSKVWTLTRNGGQATVAALNNAPTKPSSFGTDSHGTLYLVGVGNGVIYQMLAGATYIGSGAGYLRDATGATFHLRPGSRLDAAAFHGSRNLRAYTLEGALAAELSLSRPVELRAGLYLLKSSSAKADLLVVR
jgi:glucose/arabinose dehydrogenase